MKEVKVKDNGMAVEIEIIDKGEVVDEVAPDISSILCCDGLFAAFR